MNKTSLSLVAALVAVAGLATPVLAQSISGSDSSDDFNEESVLQQLRDRGVPASEVQEWGNKVQATITLADGSSSFAYFDADTLRPLDGAGGNTRVLSRLDVGAGPAIVRDNTSLTSVDPDEVGY
jgi:triphosphoribosyl-dephospho-CoA synthetase